MLVSHELMLALALAYLLASVPDALSPEPMLPLLPSVPDALSHEPILPFPPSLLLLANSHHSREIATFTLSLPLTLVLTPRLWRLGLGTSALGMVGSPSDGACGPNGGWDELGL